MYVFFLSKCHITCEITVDIAFLLLPKREYQDGVKLLISEIVTRDRPCQKDPILLKNFHQRRFDNEPTSNMKQNC